MGIPDTAALIIGLLVGGVVMLVIAGIAAEAGVKKPQPVPDRDDPRRQPGEGSTEYAVPPPPPPRDARPRSDLRPMSEVFAEISREAAAFRKEQAIRAEKRKRALAEIGVYQADVGMGLETEREA